MSTTVGCALMSIHLKGGVVTTLKSDLDLHLVVTWMQVL